MPDRIGAWRSVARRATLLGGALMVVLVARPAHSGAWVRKPGHAFIKLGANFSTLQAQLSDTVRSKLDAATYSLFAEVGLPWQMDLLIDVPYVVAANVFPGEARYVNRTLGDAHFQLDRGLPLPLQLTVALDVKVPMYTLVGTRDSSGLLEVNGALVPAANFPEVGNGMVELTPKLLYGKAFETRPGWFTTELGLKVRLGELAPGIYLASGGGLWVWPEHLALGLFSRASLDFATWRTPLLPAGRPAQGELYFAATVIVTGAPWVSWLKVLGSIGALAIATNSRTGFDASIGVAVEY